MPEAPSRIGVHVDDFRIDAKAGLRLASSLGFRAVQLGAASGEISPQQLSESGRRHLLRHTRGLGVSIAALRADLGGSRFLDGARVEQHVDRARRILELARDLGVRVVTAPVGRLLPDHARQYEVLHEALRQVAEHADRVDRVFAIETAVDAPADLKKLLEELNCRHLKVCYDPAELLMDGLDPLAAVESFADQIVLSHIRDAQPGSPERPGREANLGDGQLNLSACLERLAEAGYGGELIIRRSQSSNPGPDIQACKRYLDALLAPGAAL